MRSDEVAIGEAVASLTARLSAGPVENPAAFATQYVNDMLRNGWRPRAPRVETPSWSAERRPPPPDLLAAMRADIAAAKHVTAEIETEEPTDAR